ncbi:MAG: choice-of-anchor Q domain-containing protein [Roseibacillus sp.]
MQKLSTCLATAALSSALPALTVTTASDELDSPSGTLLSLREAIRDASAGEIITFDPTVFTGGANNRIALTEGQLLINNRLTIDASNLSENVVIDANGSATNHRVLEVSASLQAIDLTGSTATQSSNIDNPVQVPPRFPASNAIDGNFGNFTHTNDGDAMASLTLDFGSDRNMGLLRLHNRGDGCCQNRLRNLTVQLLDANDNILHTSLLLNPDNILGFTAFPFVEPNPASIDVFLPQELAARKVKISRSSPTNNSREDRLLSIGEIEAFSIVALNNLTLTGGNPAFVGGAILLDGPTSGTQLALSLKSCTLSANSSGSDGGAIFADGSGNGSFVSLSLDTCTISNNVSQGDGGGIASVSNSSGRSSLTFKKCTFSNNSTSFQGGAIFNGGLLNGNGNLFLDSCTLSSNHADSQGGAIQNNALNGDASLFLNNCTLVDNSAVGGGGIFREGNGGNESLSLRNSIIASNSTTLSGPDIGTFTTGTTSTFGSTLLSDFSGSGLTDPTTGITLVNDPLLTPLGDHGGPTLTMHPLINSPAILTGTISTRTDQRGFTLTGPPTIGAVKLPTPTKVVSEASLRFEIETGNAEERQGRVICFDPALDGQTLTLFDGELVVPSSTDALFIDASSLPNGLIIDANGQATKHRVLRIDSNSTVTLAGLTLTGGQAPTGSDGGGIFIDTDSSLNLIFSTISNNQTGKGADGSGEEGGSGGGIFLSSGSALALSQSTVAANQTGAGGSASMAPGDGGSGGGIFASQGSSLSILSSTIANNRTGFGGDVIGNDFQQGGSGGSGGGISAQPLDSFTISSSTIANNRTGDGGLSGMFTPGGLGGNGGGIQVSNSQFFIFSSTISGNHTGERRDSFSSDLHGSGGGITTVASIAEDTIFHSIVAGNFANESGEDNNLLNDDYPLFIGTTSFIEGDAMLSPLGDNGGPTQTMIPLPGSPVIDAATTSTISTDQRGFSRPLDGDNDGTSAPDIGATEAPNWTNPGLADYPSIWPTDLDQDGTDYGVELILGTDPAVSDATSTQNVTFSFPNSSQSNLLFGRTTGTIPAGAKLTVLRSTTLLPNSFEELASYDATTDQTSVPVGSNDTFVLSGNQFSLLDNSRPSAKAFYRLESEYNP